MHKPHAITMLWLGGFPALWSTGKKSPRGCGWPAASPKPRRAKSSRLSSSEVTWKYWLLLDGSLPNLPSGLALASQAKPSSSSRQNVACVCFNMYLLLVQLYLLSCFVASLGSFWNPNFSGSHRRLSQCTCLSWKSQGWSFQGAKGRYLWKHLIRAKVFECLCLNLFLRRVWSQGFLVPRAP